MALIAERCRLRDAGAVLDLGCGRGFLGRWLRERGFETSYTGVDRVADAVDAARANVRDGDIVHADFRKLAWKRTFDSVFAIEIAIDGALDQAIVDAAVSALKPGGRFVATIAATKGTIGRPAGTTVENWTDRVTPFATRTYRWWLDCDAWHPEIAGKMHEEARTLLGAIERGEFRYFVLFGEADHPSTSSG